MSTNKHASLRYRILNHCFCNRGRRKWGLDELVEEVSQYLVEEFGPNANVSKRTIQGDIQFMRSNRPLGYEAPIICRQGMYFYSDPEFSIERHPLSAAELESLQEAVGIVKQIPGMPQIATLETMLNRIRLDKPITSYIQFETNRQVRGVTWIPFIYRSIIKRQVLSIRYTPFLESENTFVFHPYLLKEWRNRWYVFGQVMPEALDFARTAALSVQLQLERFGFILRGDGLWNFAIDRISDVQVLPDIEYKSNNLFDPNTWFEDILGVTKPENATSEEITLEVDQIAAFYIESKPFHGSQKIVFSDEKKTIFQLTLIPNDELLNDILAYGRFVRVLGPDSVISMLESVRG